MKKSALCIFLITTSCILRAQNILGIFAGPVMSVVHSNILDKEKNPVSLSIGIVDLFGNSDDFFGYSDFTVNLLGTEATLYSASGGNPGQELKWITMNYSIGPAIGFNDLSVFASGGISGNLFVPGNNSFNSLSGYDIPSDHSYSVSDLQDDMFGFSGGFYLLISGGTPSLKGTIKYQQQLFNIIESGTGDNFYSNTLSATLTYLFGQ